MLNLFKSLHLGTTNLSSSNYSHIILIPKKSDQSTVRDYRPICLEYEIIKIISKVLSTRLGKVIDSLVGSCQTAFIKGRLIFESYSSIAEIINFFTKAKIPGVLLKIDLEKLFRFHFMGLPIYIAGEKRLQFRLRILANKHDSTCYFCYLNQWLPR